MYFKYVSYPEIPAGLIEPLEIIEHKKNISSTPEYDFYRVFPILPELQDFLDSIFSFKFYASIHVIRTGFPIHKDRTRTECINYLLSTGGNNTRLSIYDEDKTTELFSEHIPVKKWHWIDV